MASTSKIVQAKADTESPAMGPNSEKTASDYQKGRSSSDDPNHFKLAMEDLNPVIPNDGRAVYYIIDAESLKSGKATISIKDRTADPAPLGLLGFGLTTFLLNLHNAGAFPINSMILAMGLCYGGAAQIIAGIFEFTKGNLFAMIAFMSYGFFWWSLVFLLVFPKLGWALAPDDIAFGCYLFIWGIFTLIMFVATIFKKAPMMLSFVFFTVVLLFALLAATKWSRAAGKENWEEVEVAAGVEGVICGLSAIYMAAAEILNGFAGRTILWIGPRQ